MVWTNRDEHAGAIAGGLLTVGSRDVLETAIDPKRRKTSTYSLRLRQELAQEYFGWAGNMGCDACYTGRNLLRYYDLGMQSPG